ncbi:hypothetical protein MMC16_001073 [Acarospora aff. strigata]|nr:hypothetical protein [Acarospora aff. strigata]
MSKDSFPCTDVYKNLATSSPRWSSAAPAQRLDGKIDTFEQELSPFTFSTQSSRPKDLAISSPIVSAADPAKRLDSKRHTFEEQLSPVTFFNQSSRHKDLATSSPRLSAADPAKRLDSKIHTVEEELVLDQKLLKGADHTSPPAKVSFSDDFTSDATFDTQGKNKSRRVSDNLVVRKPSKSSSKYSSTYLTRSISFNTSLSSRTASYATAEENRPAVPSFLGRHRSQDNITSLSRSVSFGTTRELRATALTSFKGRTYSLSLITPPPRSTSLGRIQESEPIHSARPPPPVSISSTGTLQGALPYNNPLYIDLSSRSAANPEFTKQAVFVPAVISRRRQQTTSEMASQGSSNPFDDPAAMATWQGVCPVRAESAMAQPDTAHSAGVSGGQAVFSPSAPADPAATTTTPSAAAATATPPRRRGLFRRVGRALRRLLRRG